jgi:catechol 2,3-dioxygenase-like lactoylglutathione lyase family enzyme
MAAFKSPMINLYSRDLPRAVAFYSYMGFVETFRTPESADPDGNPIHLVQRRLSPAHDAL